MNEQITSCFSHGMGQSRYLIRAYLNAEWLHSSTRPQWPLQWRADQFTHFQEEVFQSVEVNMVTSESEPSRRGSWFSTPDSIII